MKTDEFPKRFEIVAYTGGKLRVDGFDDPVVVDLAGLEAEGHIPIAVKHDTDDEMILGQTDENGITNDGLTLTLAGPVTADPSQSPAAKRIVAMAQKGHKWQASIGAQIEESREVPAGETVHVNGQDLQGPFVLATSSVLRETSVLGMGADRKTSVSFAAGARINFKAASAEGDDFEAWLANDLHLDPATLSEKARSALAAQYEAQTADENDELDAAEDEDVEAAECEDMKAAAEEPDGDEPDGDEEETPPPKEGKKKVMANAKKVGGNGAALDPTIFKAQLAKARQAAAKAEADEVRRIATIKAKCKGDDLLIATAIEKNWSTDKAELEFRKRKDLKAAPAGHVRGSSPSDQLQALQGGLLIRAGVKIDHAGFGGEMGLALGLPSWLRAGINTDARQKVMEAAWRTRDMSMVDICRNLCALQADNAHNDGSNKGFIKAAVSGGALADIFSTNINAMLIQKLLEENDTTAGWTREADAANFQTMERTRLTKGPRLTRHNRAGNADMATRDDVMNSYKIVRYSQQFRIDEQDIIDDRFQALQDIPNEMGLACSRLRPDLVYAILLANGNINKEGGVTGALFSASQPNSQSNLVASGAALSSATLANAMASMFNILENNVPIQSNPTHLIVPAQLFGVAASALQSPTIVLAGTSAATVEQGVINKVAAMQQAWGMVQIVSDSRLSNGVTDPSTGTAYAGSSTKWYMASNKVPTIEVAYLRGSGRAPQVRQYILDKGEWGIGWDVNLDIGAKALAWQGLYAANA